MTQVSKIKLRPEIENRIYELFEDAVLHLRSREDVLGFLKDFLSPTERVILAKRFAIAILLLKNNDYNSISDTLRVTPNTISKVNLQIKHGGGSVRKIAQKIAVSDINKASIEELLGSLTPKKHTLTGEVYKKDLVKREKRINRLKKGL